MTRRSGFRPVRKPERQTVRNVVNFMGPKKDRRAGVDFPDDLPGVPPPFWPTFLREFWELLFAQLIRPVIAYLVVIGIVYVILLPVLYWIHSLTDLVRTLIFFAVLGIPVGSFMAYLIWLIIKESWARAREKSGQKRVK